MLHVNKRDDISNNNKNTQSNIKQLSKTIYDV